jgi:hypothetical protein
LAARDRLVDRGPNDPRQLFSGDAVSNRQMQITAAIACAWSVWLALRTRTSALSTVILRTCLPSGISVLADFGLRDWLDSTRFDLLALHLARIVAVYGGAGWWLERSGRSWFAAPAFVAAGIMLVLVLDLWAIDGKLLHYLGPEHAAPAAANRRGIRCCSTCSRHWPSAECFFYAIAAAFERRGSAAMSTAVLLLFTIAPFSILEPLAYLSRSAVYNQRFDWLYLGLAVGIALISYRRQRKSFYLRRPAQFRARPGPHRGPQSVVRQTRVGDHHRRGRHQALIAGFVLDAQRRRRSGS